jgi:hypothetical protein
MQRARKGRCEGLAPEKLQNMMAVTEVLALCRDLTGRAADKRKLRVRRSMRARLERESSSRRPSPKNASLLNNGYRLVAVPDRGRNLATMANRPNRAASFPHRGKTLPCVRWRNLRGTTVLTLEAQVALMNEKNSY